MVFIQGGTFRMGDFLGTGKKDQIPIHKVIVNSFLLSKYEVTFEEYDAFCKAVGKKFARDNNWGRGKKPVINISWYDAIEYCNWISEQQKLTPFYEIVGEKSGITMAS